MFKKNNNQQPKEELKDLPEDVLDETWYQDRVFLYYLSIFFWGTSMVYAHQDDHTVRIVFLLIIFFEVFSMLVFASSLYSIHKTRKQLKRERIEQDKQDKLNQETNQDTQDQEDK